VSLGPPGIAPRSRRPHQNGHVHGTRAAQPVSQAVEWLVDTGADISTVRSSVGAAFDVRSVAIRARPTTGGGGIRVVTGLRVEFSVKDVLRRVRAARAGGYVGIKSGNTGSDILGVDQLARAAATVTWLPATRRGRLRG